MRRGISTGTVFATTAMLALLATAVAVPAARARDKQAQRHAKVDSMAAKALRKVLSKSDSARELYEKSVGYAVFDNLKLAFGFSGGGGSGVAVAKAGERTYMKMATAGIGLGLGGQKYQVVFLFETQDALRSFVEKGWQADATAQAAAADKGANAVASFKNGIAYYQLTDKGLMASADLSGTKYWRSDNAGD
jgi:lipid-binding SYLF domain-containing protein